MEFSKEKFKPMKDRYAKSRGGPSKFLYIACGSCEEPAMIYQKDGPGKLMRCYTDRIVWPPELVSTYEDITSSTVKNAGALACSGCDETLALPMVYKPEDRPALGILPGSVHTYRSAEQAQARSLDL